MAGRPSLRRTLLFTLLSTMLLAWLVVSALIYREAWHEVNEVFDADLARSAGVLAVLLSHEVEEEREMARDAQQAGRELGPDGLRRYPRLAKILHKYQAKRDKEQLELAENIDGASHRYLSKLALLARYSNGTALLRTPGAPEFPLNDSGYFDFQQDGEHWRGYALRNQTTDFLVQVAEKTEIREELVEQIVRAFLAPSLLAVPLLALIIWLGVGRGLRPLARIAAEISNRAAGSLAPVAHNDTPQEVQPLVSALNDLLARVAETLALEQRFTADAAHELRTPLAALKTLTQVARSNSQDEPTRRALDQMLAGVDGATHLVEQLLTLARADARGRETLRGQRADLRAIAVDVVSIYGQKALDRRIDIGLDAPDSIVVRGDPAALGILLRNLTDNALRYTPAGGEVTVQVGWREGLPCLAVVDNGPGVPREERARLFDRFHRGADARSDGSGLGLSIVQRIAQLHEAQVNLEEGTGGRGLLVTVTFPVDRKMAALEN